MHKIIIKDFMAIQEAEIEIDRITLLIGEQASGKSTIAKLIYFFKSVGKDLLSSIYKNLDKQTRDISIEFNRQVKMKFSRFFGSSKHLSNFTIEYKYSDVRYIRVNNLNGKLNVFINKELGNSLFDEDLPDLLKETQKYSAKKDVYDEIRFGESISKITALIHKKLGDDYRTPVYIPASRSVTVGYSEQLQLIFDRSVNRQIIEENKASSPSTDLFLVLEFFEVVAGIKDRFENKNFKTLIVEKFDEEQNSTRLVVERASDLIAKILKGEYRSIRSFERIYFSSDRYVDLNDASSGQQEAIRVLQDLFLVLLDQRAVFRVIEEPEAHLYPMAQKHLIELIALTVNQTDSQVVITTHSPYVLSIVQNLLYAQHLANHNQGLSEEISQGIAQAYWLDPKKFHTYVLDGGKSRSIIDDKTDLIDQNALDSISEELGSEFDYMYALHTEMVRGKR